MALPPPRYVVCSDDQLAAMNKPVLAADSAELPVRLHRGTAIVLRVCIIIPPGMCVRAQG